MVYLWDDVMFKSNSFIRGYFHTNLKQYQKRYYDMIDDLDDGSYFHFDVENKIFRCGKKLANSLGIDQILYDFPDCLSSMDIMSSEDIKSILIPQKADDSIKEREFCFYTPNKTEAWYLLRYKIIKDEHNGAINVFGKFLNITKHRSHLVSLEKEAQRDKLTGLYNKTATEQLIKNYLQQRMPHEKCALFIVDVDHFKEINDTFGHLYGDAVLTNLGEHLRKTFRRSDDIIGRIGGDEFFIFIQNFGSYEIIKKKADEICNHFRKRYATADSFIEISASIGVAYAPDHAKDLESLYELADIALYQAKNKGKNQYVIYDTSQIREKYESNRTVIDEKRLQKKFEDNMLEYVFNLLYNNNDFNSSITSVLQFLAEKFGFSSGYVFEISEDAQYESCTYEWCEKNTLPSIDKMQNINISDVGHAGIPSKKDDYFIYTENTKVNSDVAEKYLNEYGIKFVVNYGIWDNDKPIGFIGFSDNKSTHSLSSELLSEIGNICRLVGLFLAKYRLKNKLDQLS